MKTPESSKLICGKLPCQSIASSKPSRLPGRMTEQVIVVLFLLLLTCLPALAQPIVDYRFDGNFDDSAAGSTILVHPDCPANPCNATSEFGSDASGTFWQWTSSNSSGGGFTIMTLDELGDTYTIRLKISFDDVLGFNKIIDYKNRSSDDGLYFISGRLRFFPVVSSEESFPAGEILDLTIARDGPSQQVALLLDFGDSNQNLFEFTDTSNRAVAEVIDGGSVLGFFHDDLVTIGEGTSGGKVYAVQIFDSFLTLFKDGFE